MPLLELVRLRLRNLVQHIDKTKQRLVYSDFEDELGDGAAVDLPQIGAVDFTRFKRKARHFLLEHRIQPDAAEAAPRTPADRIRPTTSSRLLLSAGVGDQAQIEKAAELSQRPRSLHPVAGRAGARAVAEAFSAFVSTGQATADQIEFVELVVDHLTEKGVMDPKLLYDSPFKDLAPSGPEQVFNLERTDYLFNLIESFNRSALEEVA